MHRHFDRTITRKVLGAIFILGGKDGRGWHPRKASADHSIFFSRRVNIHWFMDFNCLEN
jgi:hypothetical protein